MKTIDEITSISFLNNLHTLGSKSELKKVISVNISESIKKSINKVKRNST